MTPTLLDLDTQTKLLLKLKSQEYGVSMSELIRTIVAKNFATKSSKNPLAKIKGAIKKEDLDLKKNLEPALISQNIDNLLYGKNNSGH